MKKTTLFLLTILFLYSCQTEEKVKTVSINNLYSLSIPSFLTKANNLNDDASLQYQHLRKEFYVIVINEPKSELKKALLENNLTEQYSDNLKGYSDLILDSFVEEIQVYRKSSTIDTLINNMPAKLLTISGKVEGISVFYSLAFIEGKEQYYQIMSWALEENKNQYLHKMEKIMYSLQELYNL